MAPVSVEDWVTKLQDALTQLKVSSSNVESRLDQIQQCMQKLENVMEEMKNVTSNQETRLQLLEAHCGRIPDMFNEDFVLMKAHLKIYQRLLWIVTTVVVGIVGKLILGPML